MSTGRRVTITISVILAVSLSHISLSSAFSKMITPGVGLKPFSRLSSTASESEGLEQVVIVGGGIAGLATAAALQNIANISGIQVLEKSSHESFSQKEGIGAGAQLGPNGLRALRAIGGEELMQRVIDAGSILKGNAIVIPGMSHPMLQPDSTEEDSGLPQVFVRWSVLRRILKDLLAPEVNIRTNAGSDLCGYEVADDGSLNILSESGGVILSTPSASTSLIVGADGAVSKCRYWVQTGQSNIPAKEIEKVNTCDIVDTGRINIKAVVPKSLGDSFEEGYTYCFFAPGGGVACFAGPAGENYTYWAISIVDEKDEETGEVTDFLANIADKSDMKEVKLALLAKLSSLGTDDVKFAFDMIEATAPEIIYASRSKEAQNIGPSLATNDGKVVLVGDAAHAMSGAYGQNPNFALEGAAELATCIRNSICVKTALLEYSSQRVGRCVEMQKRSAERATKAMKGEKDLENVSEWIHSWDVK